MLQFLEINNVKCTLKKLRFLLIFSGHIFFNNDDDAGKRWVYQSYGRRFSENSS